MRSNLIYGEDLRAGTVYELGQYAVTEDELIAFATQWDPLDLHIDKAAAKAGHYRGLIASGIQTVAIYQRLAVKTVFWNWALIAGRKLHSAEFLRPVRAGDTLSGQLHIDSVRVEPQNRALVATSATLTNQHAKSVLRLHLDAYVHVRTKAGAR